uniref:Myosinlike protein putative n=1 Tax=Albugo laibachii Nc14 TaxID=890382 RepID=F0WYT1_9STRA|nr:myosinlike protein putative [Albugo laibachii Nc14]|eukprot:CCA26640.1 myosinlike protein putative [Albugo laibachii Nc14]
MITNQNERQVVSILQILRQREYDLVYERVTDRESECEYNGDRVSDPNLVDTFDDLTATSSDLLALRDSKNEQTVLHLACKRGHRDVLRALADLPETSALVNQGDRHGNTALHFAASCPKLSLAIKMVRILFKLGADPNSLNIRNQTPLATHLMTVKVDDPSLVREYVCHMNIGSEECDPSPLNRHVGTLSTTYLHLATERNHMEIASFLVENGASINILSGESLTVSDIVSKKQLIKLISVMREGQQPPQSHAIRTHCKLCRYELDTGSLCDCYLCGRPVCTSCSMGENDWKTKEEKGIEMRLLTQTNAYRNFPGSRLCVVCITVLTRKEKQKKEREVFMMKLHGCSGYQ